MISVAIQGVAGSFHDQAAKKFFNSTDIKLVERRTFRDVFDAIKSGKANRGLVAIENSLHGSINPVYRLLAQEKLWVCGEIRLKVELFLLYSQQIPKKNFIAIDKVLSQAEALAQCEQWLQTHMPQAIVEETYDTAQSVQFVMRYPERATAAIAGKQAAELYKAAILAGPINDDPENYTRFFVLSKNKVLTPNENRTSIILTEGEADHPGTLLEALKTFKNLSINLSKLDSHPLPGADRRYAFYLDFDTGANTAAGKQALQALKQHGWRVTLLGSYQNDSKA